MRSIRTGFAVLAVVAVLVLGGAGGAAASSYWPTSAPPPNWEKLHGNDPSLAPYVSGIVGGYLTPIGYHSTRTIGLLADYLAAPVWQQTPGGGMWVGPTPLFTNQNLAADFGQSKWVPNLSLVGFKTTVPRQGLIPSYDYATALIAPQGTVYRLTDAWTLNNTLTLPVGAIILGCFDTGVFSDPNEFILAISATAPTVTPIPGAVWLLGSGLAGLMAMRRKRRA